MSLQDHIGNEMVKNAIRKNLENNILSHFYIFNGEDGIGKVDLVMEFIKSIYCKENLYKNHECLSCKKVMSNNHSDIYYIEKEEKKKSIGIDVIRNKVNNTVKLPPFESEKKIYVIKRGEQLTVESQNALLKTIEEPPEYVIFIFITNNINKLLPTVLSRAVVFNCKKLNRKEMEKYIGKNFPLEKKEKNNLEFLTNMADGNINTLNSLINNEEFNDRRKKLIDILINIESKNLVETLFYYKFFNENKEYIDEIFVNMLIWYRDISVYKDTMDLSLIIQQDRKDDIIYMSTKFTISNLVNKNKIIENTIKFLEMNSNFQITIENMLLSLKEK